MAVESLKCKECGESYPLDARFVCEQCFGPLEVAYDFSRPRSRRGAAEDPGRVARHLAVFGLPALRGPARRSAGARADAADPRRPARRAARAGRALDQERRGQPDTLLQGPRRRRGDRQGEGARLRDRRLRVDREPRQRRRRPLRRRRPRLLRLRPRRPRGAEAARHRASTAPTWSASAAPTTTSTGSVPSSARPTPGPSSTSTCAPTTPRARRRWRSRRSSSSAGSLPDRVVAPIASGSIFTKVAKGMTRLARAGAGRGRSAGLLRRAGAGLLARGDRVRRGLGRLQAASAARHDRQEPRDRGSRPTAPTRSTWRGAQAASSSPSPTRRSATASGCSPRRPASSRRRPAA